MTKDGEGKREKERKGLCENFLKSFVDALEYEEGGAGGLVGLNKFYKILQFVKITNF